MVVGRARPVSRVRTIARLRVRCGAQYTVVVALACPADAVRANVTGFPVGARRAQRAATVHECFLPIFHPVQARKVKRGWAHGRGLRAVPRPDVDHMPLPGPPGHYIVARRIPKPSQGTGRPCLSHGRRVSTRRFRAEDVRGIGMVHRSRFAGGALRLRRRRIPCWLTCRRARRRCLCRRQCRT